MLKVDFEPETKHDPNSLPERLAAIWRGWLLEGSILVAGAYVYFDLARWLTPPH
jgi:hypothetical protein